MENKINIAELLKDCPKGMKLDCTIFDTKVIYQGLNKRIPTHPIVFLTEHGFEFELTQYGQTHNIVGSKCVIFPKGKTTWEGFVPPCKFEDGDIITCSNGVCTFTSIFKNKPTETTFKQYCSVLLDNNQFMEGLTYYVDDYNLRFATEEEKAKLFKAIKDYGYKWNDETKTLEKLVESEEDTDDRVVMSGIYFDRENYADEVELHLGNYEIEIRNGKTYAIFKNQKTETLKPKFKVGDIIANGKTTIKIGYIDDDYYYEIGGNIANRLYIKNQDDWELVKDNIKPKFKVGDRIIKRDSIVNSWIVSSVSSEYYGLQLPNGEGIGVLSIVEQDDYELVSDIEPKFKKGDRIKHKVNTEWVCTIRRVEDRYYVDGHPTCYTILFDKQDEYELVHNKFDINTLKPFESRVLVRNSDNGFWQPTFWGIYEAEKVNEHHYRNYLTTKGFFRHCIPYNDDTKHLIGTTDDCDEFYKTWK